MYFSRFLITSAEQLFLRVPFDGCFRRKNNILKNFDPLRKAYLFMRLFIAFEITRNENYLKNCKESCSGESILQQISRLGLCY